MPDAARHPADETLDDPRRIADQAVTLPTKPPIPFGIFDDALNRKLNDGQDAPSWPGEDFLVGWSGAARFTWRSAPARDTTRAEGTTPPCLTHHRRI